MVEAYLVMSVKMLNSLVFLLTHLGPFGVNEDGSSIKSDSNGDASGLLIFPAGKAPLQNATWTGDINSVAYETSDGRRIKLHYWHQDY